MRRQFRGQRPLVKIGYGSDKVTKYRRPNHFYTFLVKNVNDVDLLLMHNRNYAAEIAHDVGYKKRLAIIARAQQLDVKVTNANARVRTTD
jgi:large subunit ribosomal protein L32e